jgi:hypothetical protein
MPGRLRATLTALDALDEHREGLSALVSSLPVETVRRRPAPGAWSLAQLLDHLLRIDRGLDFGARPGSRLVRATSPARSAAVRAVLALPIRIPAPPGAAAVMPAPDPDVLATLLEWGRLRASWRERMAEATAADLDRLAFRHPLAGPFCLPDALAFLLAHHRHHDAQVRRTLQALAAAA